MFSDSPTPVTSRPSQRWTNVGWGKVKVIMHRIQKQRNVLTQAGNSKQGEVIWGFWYFNVSVKVVEE